MLWLTTTSSLLQVTTGTGVSTIYVQASYVDLNSGAGTPGYQNTAITTATTTTVISSPASSTQRAVKFVSIQNSSASSSKITVIHTDGTTAVNVFVYTLLAGEAIYFAEGHGWYAVDANGNEKTSNSGAKPTNVTVTASGPGLFQVAHGLGVSPKAAVIAMTSATAFWFQVALPYDGTYLYLDAASSGTAIVVCFT